MGAPAPQAAQQVACLKKQICSPPAKSLAPYIVWERNVDRFLRSRGGCVGKELGGALFCMQNTCRHAQATYKTIYPHVDETFARHRKKIRKSKTCPKYLGSFGRPALRTCPDFGGVLGGLPPKLPKFQAGCGRPAPQAARRLGRQPSQKST